MGNITGSRGRGLRSIIRAEDFDARITPELLRNWEGVFRQLARLKDRDDVKNGKIRRKEFDSALLHPLGLTFDGENAVFRERTFRALECGEGGINFEDFCLAALILSPQGLLSERLKLTFKLYDHNASGFVEPLPFWQLLEQLEQLQRASASASASGSSASPGGAPASGQPSSSPSTAGGAASGGGERSAASDAKPRSSGSGAVGNRSGGGGGGGGGDKQKPQIQLPPGRNADIVRGIFDRFDKNQDLRLSYLEFAQFLEESPFARTAIKSFVDPSDLAPL